jgi:hypothetical protein
MSLQKWGGVAALYETAAYVVGIVGFLGVVDVRGVDDPAEQVALLVENQTFLSIMHMIVYVFWGIFLVVVALALYERLKAGSPGMALTATVFGLIWAGLVIASGTLYNVGMETIADLFAKDPAQATTVWLAIRTVYDGLTGVEVLGSIWVLLVSWAALRGGGLPKPLIYLGVVIGVAGLLTVVPALFDVVVMIYALGQIVWFAWVGIVMLRSSSGAAAADATT